MFDVEMVEYLKSVRTLSQADVDRIAKEKGQDAIAPEDYYEAHGHHAEHVA